MSRLTRPRGMTLGEAFEWWMPGLVPPILECWEWPGSRLPKGYGVLSFGGSHVYAHVVAHQLFVGPVLKGEVVRHRCNHPPCVHPAHILKGTYADNSADMVHAGRQAYGASLPHTKLTEDDVLVIRSRRTETSRRLAEEYGVSTSLIDAIKWGKYGDTFAKIRAWWTG